jgi:hypothetical protein
MAIPEFLAARLDDAAKTARFVQAEIGDGVGVTVYGQNVYDPAHVLAEVAAKRALLAQLQHKRDSFQRYPNQGNANGMFELERVAQMLAQPYADHPDFDPAWAVQQ